MANINFKPGNQKKRALKRSPSKYQESGGRPNISMSDGIAPAYPAVPYKHLPASFQDINTQDWVVIPKGRLVSMVLSTNTDWKSTWQTGMTSKVADSNGAYGAIEIDNDSYYGVSKNIKGLLVPANGGKKQVYQYGASSVGVVPAVSGGAMVAAADDTLTIGGNAPVGVVEHDVYQDIRGANLNYDMRNKNWGVLAQQFIKLPCVDLAKWNDSANGIAATEFAPDKANADVVVAGTPEPWTMGAGDTVVALTLPAGSETPVSGIVVKDSNGDPVAEDAANYTVDLAAGEVTLVSGGAIGNTDTGTIEFNATDSDAGADAPTDVVADDYYNIAKFKGYKAVADKFAFLTMNTEEEGQGLAGTLLQADAFGNWMCQSMSSGIQTRNNQTAGRLLGVDFRYEKDLLDTVQSRYEDNPAFAVAGAGTYGVPQYLYNFAYAAVTGAGHSFTAGKEASEIKALCDAGVFGEAWIQLNCQ